MGLDLFSLVYLGRVRPHAHTSVPRIVGNTQQQYITLARGDQEKVLQKLRWQQPMDVKLLVVIHSGSYILTCLGIFR